MAQVLTTPIFSTTAIVSLVTSTIIGAPTSGSYRPTETGSPPSSDDGADGNLIDRLASGAKAALIFGVILGIIFIVLFSSWFCCGCCGVRNRQRGMAPNGTRRIPPNNSHPIPANGGSLPLQPVQYGTPPATDTPPTEPAPPSYEEVVLPRNQAPLGGLTLSRVVEHDEMIADGKTPLSETISVDSARPDTGESSSRDFQQRHHGAGGDTRGHTNS